MSRNLGLWNWCAPVVLIGTLGLGSAAPEASGPAKEPGGAVTASNIRIGNFGQIGDVYYRGEQPVDRDYSDLAALGVRTVIDLQADGRADEEAAVERAGMSFFRIPMTTRIAPTAAQVAEFLGIVTDPANQPVYVHCAGGRHRTGVMTAIYRMERDGWTADRAFGEMKQYNFGPDFLHPEFKKFVYSYRPAAAMELSLAPGHPRSSSAAR